VRKVIRALPLSWKVNSTTLKELKNKEEIEIFGLIWNLKTNETERKAREEKAPKRRRLLPSNSLPPSLTKKKMTKKMMKICPSS